MAVAVGMETRRVRGRGGTDDVEIGHQAVCGVDVTAVVCCEGAGSGPVREVSMEYSNHSPKTTENEKEPDRRPAYPN